MENQTSLAAFKPNDEDYAFDLTYREYSVRVIRTFAVAELLVCIPFYALLACRWRLTETIHWFMCNFLVSEILRTVATILRGAIESIMLPILQRQIPDNNYSKVTNDMMTFLNTRTVLDGVLEIGHFLSLVFALITLYHYYKQLKNPCVTERCHKSNFIQSLAAWSIAIFYFAIVTGLRIHIDQFLLVFFWDDVITILFYATFIIASTMLLVLLVYLFYLQYPKEDEYMQKNVKMFMRRTNKRIGILAFLILVVVAPAPMMIFVVSVELKKGKSTRSDDVARAVLEDFAQLWLSMLAIVWPFIWISLDSSLNQDFQKFSLLFKKKEIPEKGRVRFLRKQ